MLTKKILPLFVLTVLAGSLLAHAEEKSADALKSRYVYTEAHSTTVSTSSVPDEAIDFRLVGESNSDTTSMPGRTIEAPASCVMGGKQFVNCRR
jgi:hypothetical protein